MRYWLAITPFDQSDIELTFSELEPAYSERNVFEIDQKSFRYLQWVQKHYKSFKELEQNVRYILKHHRLVT